MADNSILQASNVVKTFGRGHAAVRAVDDVSLSVAGGELVMVMGPSGSGKTTLVSMLGALLTPDSGTITVDGVVLGMLNESGISALRARKIGFVFQSFNLLDALSVRQNVLLPASLASGGTRSARSKADALLESLNLEHRRDAMPNTLSGGEKQRTAIARALINGPKLIFADEPTGNLDSQSGQEVMMVLHDIARDQGCSVVLVTHDQRVMDVADRILWMEDGKLQDRRTDKRSWVRDPVCGMQVDEWTATLFSDFRGQRYAFCSRRCVERFELDPAKYIEEQSSAQAWEQNRTTPDD
jgi:putative ABC transport system ATP-binding protein